MGVGTDLIYDVKRKMLAKYPRFGSEIAGANIEFEENLPCHTAATDGKNIYVDYDYFESLNEDDRLFLIAHEIMHIKFMHMFRLVDKDGKKRDLNLWNIATDAIINANLERDGFTIKEGYVNMPEALNYSSEEFYQKLLKEKKQNEQQNKQKQEQGNAQQQGQESGQSKEQDGEQNQQDKQSQNKQQGDDHSIWEKAFEQQQDSKEKDQKQSDTRRKRRATTRTN